MPQLTPSALETFAEELLRKGGATPLEAGVVAADLVGANLRGYDSHGVMRLVDYVTRLGNGQVVSKAPFSVLAESPSHLVADAHWGFGQVQARRLFDLLSGKAASVPVVAGTLRNAGHVGRLGEYCEMAAARNLISMITVNNNGAARRVAPPGGKAPRLSTNPLAIGVPHANEPLVIDMSTSATAEGKVRVKRIAGEQCPEGWLIDSEGRPTTDPNALYANPPGAILPMGGAQAYKGFGLALMIEVLSGALSRGHVVQEGPQHQIGNCLFMLLINPDPFCGTNDFACQVSALAQFLRATPCVPGVSEVLLPGDPERRSLARRSAEGIYVDDENWAALVKLARQFNVTPPQGKPERPA